ncbi:hypothetical protein GE061_007658 [Apolygus lucorum]|uniref:Uncharacterized protein n=1 Tax=Apolygus lucorum TaxID=248454 RepID=A0A8S9WQ30_APOLU|nr:hypothetical protein GE061_007658 [Apolygus lucorum]
MTHPANTVIKNPTWWRRRTHLERSLLVMFIVSSVVALALFVSLAVLNLRNRESPILMNSEHNHSPILG